MDFTVKSPSFWFFFIWVIFASLVPDLTAMHIQRQFFPFLWQIVQEKASEEKTSEGKEPGNEKGDQDEESESSEEPNPEKPENDNVEDDIDSFDDTNDIVLKRMDLDGKSDDDDEKVQDDNDHLKKSDGEKKSEVKKSEEKKRRECVEKKVEWDIREKERRGERLSQAEIQFGDEDH